jgi:hypothetical protein
MTSDHYIIVTTDTAFWFVGPFATRDEAIGWGWLKARSRTEANQFSGWRWNPIQLAGIETMVIPVTMPPDEAERLIPHMHFGTENNDISHVLWRARDQLRRDKDAAEDTMASDCPDHTLTGSEQRQIAAGTLDFVDGNWVTPIWDLT